VPTPRWSRWATRHRYSPVCLLPRSAVLRSCWAPSPSGRLSRPRSTTGPPPRPGPFDRPCVHPHRCAAGGGGRPGEPERFPRSSAKPFDGIGTQLCPCTIATTTPQAFTVASPTSDFTQPGSSPTAQGPSGARCDPTQIRQVSGRWFSLEKRSAAGSSRMPTPPADADHHWTPPAWRRRGSPDHEPQTDTSAVLRQSPQTVETPFLDFVLAGSSFR
jgi:hypothetical protein